MIVLPVRNVCEALPLGLRYLLDHGRPEPSRAGDVLVAPGPVTTVYQHPRERVVTAPARDANPFFHLMEALWMLAGRDDATFLDRYVKDFSARFAEPGGRQHGAYGARWRRHFWSADNDKTRLDQLDWAVRKLRADPTSRQVVIEMWDPRADTTDLPLRDRPCNTHINLRVWDQSTQPVLNMMVTCRSNDIILGAYGANAVHMSILQEYLAARIGVPVGTYEQVSFNFHAYTAELDRVRGRAGVAPGAIAEHDLHMLDSLAGGPYDHTPPGTMVRPLVEDPGAFDEELGHFLTAIDQDAPLDMRVDSVRNTFLSRTVWPMECAHRLCRRGRMPQALGMAQTVVAPDWRRAAVEWLGRRIKT